jgi:hypothetical protein
VLSRVEGALQEFFTSRDSAEALEAVAELRPAPYSLQVLEKILNVYLDAKVRVCVCVCLCVSVCVCLVVFS